MGYPRRQRGEIGIGPRQLKSKSTPHLFCKCGVPRVFLFLPRVSHGDDVAVLADLVVAFLAAGHGFALLGDAGLGERGFVEEGEGFEYFSDGGQGALVEGVNGAAVGGLELIGVTEGFSEVSFGHFDGPGEGFAAGEGGGDGGGKGAAGAVGAVDGNAWRGETEDLALIHEQIEAVRAGEVAAFEEDGGAEFLGEFAGGIFQRGFVRDGLA